MGLEIRTDKYDQPNFIYLIYVRKLVIVLPLANLVYYPIRFYWFYGC